MRFDPTDLSLRFGSREELDRFHHDLSDLLRRVIVGGMTAGAGAVEGATHAREEMRRYALVTRSLNALRQHLRGGEEAAAGRRRAVVALGGNAFVDEERGLTMAGQFRFARRALTSLGPLLGDDVALVIVHGNGPQVGHMLVRVEESLGKAYALPLEVCVAESEGELGYVLAQVLRNVLAEGGTQRPVASILTQVTVDADDPGFAHPTKPIGPWYTAAQAEELRARGFALVDDAGRGMRRVVPSPEPRSVVEADVVQTLLDHGAVVVAAGGGGVPVVERDGCLHGVDAVVDKDLTAALLADTIGAELLVILTAVPCAYLDFCKPTQQPLGRVTASDARAHLAAGHFAPGSMAPKVDAAVRFATRPGRRAIITDPQHLAEAMAGEAGTIVVPDDASA